MGNGTKTFVIRYSIYLNNNGEIEEISDKEIIVKNQFNELGAKINLEDYLKRKYSNFNKLVVHNCMEQNQFTDIFNSWFGGNKDNPFGGLF